MIEEMYELLQCLRMREIRGTKMDVVVFDSQTAKGDEPVPSVGRAGPTQVYGTPNTQFQKESLKSEGRAGSPGHSPCLW